LADLRRVILDRGITSIAVPPLGCGNGGLDWRDVRPLIDEALGDLPGVRVLVYPPQDAPPPATMPVRTQRPRMTIGRAALLALLGEYSELSRLEGATFTRGGASLLEIQKLMYFLQEAGQPLRLSYAKGRYGPYADNLNHVLQALEGHYLRGYGDRTQKILDLSPITLIDGADGEARQWLEANADDATARRIADVVKLITDFASPYGVELLATVHWTATRNTGHRLRRPHGGRPRLESPQGTPVHRAPRARGNRAPASTQLARLLELASSPSGRIATIAAGPARADYRFGPGRGPRRPRRRRVGCLGRPRAGAGGRARPARPRPCPVPCCPAARRGA
jgi:O-acetyl-ADP-ribose deacetylase (regulator of RNase III)